MEILSESQAIFRQLAATSESGAVKVVIENHDAWLHHLELGSPPPLAALQMACAGVARSPAAATRIRMQRTRLRPLLTTLPATLSNAS